MAQLTIYTHDPDFNVTSIYGENGLVEKKSKVVTIGKKISKKRDLDQELCF